MNFRKSIDVRKSVTRVQCEVLILVNNIVGFFFFLFFIIVFLSNLSPAIYCHSPKIGRLGIGLL